MTNPADYHECVVAMLDGHGVQREFVADSVYDRVVGALKERLAETVEFARAHGLTDEQWEAWKASR